MKDSANTRFAWRDRGLHLMVGLIWCLLAARLIHIQVICRADFASKALRQQVSEEVILSRPGDIVDRKGRLLATTVTVPSLYLIPNQMEAGEIKTTALQLAETLQLDAALLQKRIEKSTSKQFLWVQRHLTAEAVDKLQALNLPKQIYGFRSEFKRYYPQEELAAHVVGLRDIDGIGRGGIEQTFDTALTGKDGVRRFVRDARGFVLEVLEEVTEPPVDGSSLKLTLDIVMQLTVEQQLDGLMQTHAPLSACAIVLDPNTAEVLAMSSRPTFNPNAPETASEAAWKNQCIASVYEPGSTIKPLIVSWALDQQLINRDEMLDCERGAYKMGPRVLHDTHPYGLLSVSDVLVKSSNIGMAKIGERLGNPEIYRAVTTFGFGRKTGIELPGELPGLLRPLEKWDGYSTGSIPMGQEIAVTPIQMITAHAALANGGRKVTPHLLLSKGSGAREVKHVVVSKVVNTTQADWVVQTPMVDVVKRGTGRNAQLNDYTVFGKTGTAQKIDPQTGQYSHTRTICSFLCGAPASKPILLVLVSVDEPTGESQFGGTLAAPTAAVILDQCLKILGEPAEQPLLASPTVAPAR